MRSFDPDVVMRLLDLVAEIAGSAPRLADYLGRHPGVMDALEKGIIMTSFFSPLGETGIPTARSDEAGAATLLRDARAVAGAEDNPQAAPVRTAELAALARKAWSG